MFDLIRWRVARRRKRTREGGQAMDAQLETARRLAAVRGAGFGVLACCVLPLFLHAQPSGSVGGRVIAADGRPIACVTVTVDHAAIAVTTNASGRYMLPKVPRGARELQ